MPALDPKLRTDARARSQKRLRKLQLMTADTATIERAFADPRTALDLTPHYSTSEVLAVVGDLRAAHAAGDRAKMDHLLPTVWSYLYVLTQQRDAAMALHDRTGASRSTSGKSKPTTEQRRKQHREKAAKREENERRAAAKRAIEAEDTDYALLVRLVQGEFTSCPTAREFTWHVRSLAVRGRQGQPPSLVVDRSGRPRGHFRIAQTSVVFDLLEAWKRCRAAYRVAA